MKEDLRMIERSAELYSEILLIPRFNNNPYRALKHELMKEFGHCFWCGIIVKDYGNIHFHSPPPDSATIDHLESRFTREKGKMVDKVLCCDFCNQKRAQKENKLYSKKTKTLDSFSCDFAILF